MDQATSLSDALQQAREAASAAALRDAPALKPKSARPTPPKAAKPAPAKPDQRQKCTLLLEPDTDLRLSIAAHRHGLTRSAYVEILLADLLAPIIVSVRGQLPQLPGSAQITQALESGS